MLKEKTGLIPRYNWDYNISGFLKAFAAAFQSNPDSEEAFQNLFGQDPIFTISGRTSLYAILKSLRLPQGSKVGVPLFCCPVVFDAVKQAGLVPKFIDINPEDYSISYIDINKKHGSLSAIVVVHMFGHPADMDSIRSASGSLPIIEDCAQSLFSQYKGQYAGFLSGISFFSFRSGKYISAGEGSAIFSDKPLLRDSLKEIVARFDENGLVKELIHCTSTYIKTVLYNRPWYGTIGYPVGTRLDQRLNLTSKSGFKFNQIAKTDLRIINDRLENFLEKVQKQRENSLYLLKNIKSDGVVLPVEREDCWSNWYQFVIRFKDSNQRDAMSDFLFKGGVDTAKYLDDVVDVAKRDYSYEGDCPNAEHCSKTVLVIPNYYTLSKRDLDHIISLINEGCRILGI